MAYVHISDIVEPKSFADYVIQRSLEKNLFLRSGIAVTDPAIRQIASDGGRTFELPRWLTLSTSVNSVAATDTTDEITPNGLSAQSQLVIKNLRSVAWQYPNVIELVAGSDPAMVIANRIADWNLSDDTAVLLSILKGIFMTGTDMQEEHEVDIHTEDGASVGAENKINDSAIQDARFKLGDRFDELAGIIMHSAVYKTLENLDLIDVIPPSAQHPEPIRMYHGLRVLIDDGMTREAIANPSGENKYKYYTYLFGRGAFVYSYLDTPAGLKTFETYNDPFKGKGSGFTTVFYRKHFILHPMGFTWAGSNNYPNNPDFEAADVYDSVYDLKEIKIARIVSNG